MKQVNIQFPLRMLGLILGLFLSVSAFAQIEVKGHVKDATGEAIIGATVRVDGTQTATVTDFDGNFVLKANQGANITISYVGYQNATVKAAPSVEVTLVDDETVLQDVVVIGYGSVRKSDATGSVTSVEADQLNKGLATSPADLLQGKTPGVQVTTNSGAPGAGAKIRIRGGSSLSASNDPLIVIDGLPISSTEISGGDLLNTINPNDIESFSILKDASATKKGKAGAKPRINVDMSGTFKTVAKKVDVLSADAFRDFFTANYGDNADDMAALGNANTKWQDEIYKNAFAEEINASVTGGYVSKEQAFKMPYRVSAGFLNNDGTLKTTGMSRGTLGFNLTPTLFDDRLTINLNAKGVFTHNKFADEGAIGAAVQYNPLKSVDHKWESNGAPNTMSTLNPVAMLNEQHKSSYVRRFIGNAQFDYKFKFLDGLRANLNLGIDYSTTSGWNITDMGSEISYHNKVENGTGLWEKYTQKRNDKTLEFYLAYARELKEIYSRFDVLAGYSWQHFHNETTNEKESNDGHHTRLYGDPTLFKTESYLISFYGRLNYTFMDRYLLTFTIRDDGTSRFQNNKWGVFPSAALAWRMTEEPFLRNVDWLSNLKLRLGWGITGQQNINQGDYPSIATYHTNQHGSYYWFGNNEIIPITPKGYAAQIKWEETTTYNIGLDFGFMRNRINGSIDVYKRVTKDLLNRVPVAAGTNLTNYLLMNVGDMENKGIEVALNVVPIEKKDLRWEVGVNVSYNKNEITKLTASDDPSYPGVEAGGISGGVGNNIQIQKVGNPINSFYVLQQVYDEAGKPLEGVYVDRNHDGQITDDDRYVYYKPDADVNIGLNTELSYKKWTLSAAFRSSLGNYVYNNVASNTEMKADMWTNNFICNRVSTAPNTNFQQAQYKSDYYVQNASFLKLDKVTLAYNLASWVRLNFTAQNVFTITKYDGVDPEVANGIDNNMYPRSRNFILGASFNF